MTSALPATGARISLSPLKSGKQTQNAKNTRSATSDSSIQIRDESAFASSRKLPQLSKIAEDSRLAAAEACALVPPARSARSPVVTEVTGSHLLDDKFRMVACEPIARTDLDPVEQFVLAAVKDQHALADGTLADNYRVIVGAMRSKQNLDLLSKIFVALRTAGSTLSLLTSSATQHARLIHQIMRFVPFGDGSGDSYALADSQFHLMVALVSSNSVFLLPALTALWKMLTFQIKHSPVERTQRIHAVLATVVRLCPKAKTELFPLISANAPFRMRPEPELVWYYTQSLYVLEYLPTIRGQVLKLMIDRCLQLDVEIKITDIGEVTIDPSSTGPRDTDGVFILEAPSEMAISPNTAQVDEMADKLDALMLLLFNHVQTSIECGISAPTLYDTLSHVFESSVLITHKSKFVQFLLLHVCGFQTSRLSDTNEVDEPRLLYREFAGSLINILIDPYRATVTRQSGACYLASFVSRAKYVCVETACEAIDALLRWAEAYIKSLGVFSVHAADAREQCYLHSLFYTVCQAAYYIMCFRGTEVLQYSHAAATCGPVDEYLEIDLGAERWTAICVHPLLPLRYCLESVRSEFLRISKLFALLEDDVSSRLAYDDSNQGGDVRRIPKKKRRSVISTPVTVERERLRGGVGGLGRGTNPLDSFFPFDPYLLRQSSICIELFYQHWEGGALPTFDSKPGKADQVEDGDGEDAETDKNDTDTDDDDSDSDDGSQTDVSRKRERLMSFASNATSVSSAPMESTSEWDISTAAANSAQIQKVWVESLKREHASSLDCGSW